MGAAIGVLVGFFFGVWAGVVASTDDIEHTEELSGHRSLGGMSTV
jgi:hypothetical protein